MESILNKISEKAGLAPGTAVPVGVDSGSPSRFVITTLEQGRVTTDARGSMGEEMPQHPEGTVLWIDVESYTGMFSIAKIFSALGVHPLFQEDLLNTQQRIKCERIGNSLLIVTKRLYTSSTGRICEEQVSFLLQDNVVLTFQPAARDSFEGVRNRIQDIAWTDRMPGYVVYSLLDNLVDNYYGIIEKLQAGLDKLERQLVAEAVAPLPEELAGLRRDVNVARRSIQPLQGIVDHLGSGESAEFFPAGMEPYFADLRDHVRQLQEMCYIAAETMDTVLRLNNDNIKSRTNSMEKTAALMSAVFLPLIFIASVYGMNFEYMPELKSRLGYPAVLGLMAIIAICLYKSFSSRHKF